MLTTSCLWLIEPVLWYYCTIHLYLYTVLPSNCTFLMISKLLFTVKLDGEIIVDLPRIPMIDRRVAAVVSSDSRESYALCLIITLASLIQYQPVSQHTIDRSVFFLHWNGDHAAWSLILSARSREGDVLQWWQMCSDQWLVFIEQNYICLCWRGFRGDRCGKYNQGSIVSIHDTIHVSFAMLVHLTAGFPND